MTSLRARDGLQIVGSCRDITADLTRTYSGRCMESDGTGLGDRAIESLRRIHLLVYELDCYGTRTGWRTNDAALGCLQGRRACAAR